MEWPPPSFPFPVFNSYDMPYTSQPYHNNQYAQAARPGQSGPFHNSSHFVVKDSHFFDQSVVEIHNHNHYYYPHTGAYVAGLLSQSSLHHAELYSQARYPQPECLDGTRKDLIRDFQSWMSGRDVRYDAVWLYGPMGVGKTAIAQTLGQWAERNKVLGAALFLSKSEDQYDSNRIIISIAFQLAVCPSLKDGPYGYRIGEQLAADGALLSKDIATQFKKLIVEPLSGLHLPQRLVIIIDGLDECLDDQEQCDILRLISRAVHSPNPPQSLPLMWMICSRPEPHIRHTVLRAFKTRCDRKEVPMDDDDIRLYINDGFTHIKDNTYPDAFDPKEVWPIVEESEKIVLSSSGLFIYASTAIKFIKDPSLASPKLQLKIFLEFIEESNQISAPTSRRTNPLKPIDALYDRILSRVHETLLSTTLRLIGISATYPQLPVLELANLLDLSQESFYAALHRVHSVVNVPLSDIAPIGYLRFFHTSFTDFLKDPARSGRFSLVMGDIHSTFAAACFKALGKTKVLYAKNLPWKTNRPNGLTIAHHVLSYAATHVWKACISVGDTGDVMPLFDVIVHFDFTRLLFVKRMIPVSGLRDFVKWLSKQQENQPHDIIKWHEVDPLLFVRSFNFLVTLINQVLYRDLVLQKAGDIALRLAMDREPYLST
ncbi:hypothetical protein P691DRAFT_805674 [Macrolepiota fuliginosa MF-IS2]|uniref:NACHT domain-containing protein n=1 Tax=Macrolepiota fuliginosa MF-IS2 TaxID=1400762 RepID=A0A9P6BYS4_9AGAR|nr:hypothetical protein P691DRAFT_805674 [Macrolepiota fuliginosa MF-IS2]